MSRLHTITSLQDPLIRLVEDDPVRPEIPASFRVSETSEIFVLQNSDSFEPEAVVCVAYRDSTPADILELAREPEGMVNTAVFYTIWSYTAGAGRDLIVEAQRSIEAEFPGIQTYVTLSPKTEMARRFHLKNGARELRENPDTINYIYK